MTNSMNANDGQQNLLIRTRPGRRGGRANETPGDDLSPVPFTRRPVVQQATVALVVGYLARRVSARRVASRASGGRATTAAWVTGGGQPKSVSGCAGLTVCRHDLTGKELHPRSLGCIEKPEQEVIRPPIHV